MRSVFTAALLLAACATAAGARPSHAKWPPKDYALVYGPWDEAKIAQVQGYDLLVVHPGTDSDNLTPELVSRLKAGKDGKPGTSDDVLVLAYVTIGEDDHPPAGPPGKGEGPVALVGSKRVPQKHGYPSRFLDQHAFSFDAKGDIKRGLDGKPVSRPGQDGVPDENGVWGSFYVDAGDPEWRKLLLAHMTDLKTRLAIDGFFLDTLDTAAPYAAYGATQAGLAGTLQQLRSTFPDSFLLANRGMFLLESFPAAYKSSVDGVLYESLYTNWDWTSKQGVQSPWVKGDYEYLKSPVLPAAQGKDGFHLFYVDYLDPNQPDFYPMLHCIEDLVGRKGVSNYISDPALQGISKPWSELFPESGGTPPQLASMSVKEEDGGRFALTCKLDGLDGRKLGKDLFLDVRIGREKAAVPKEIGLLPPVVVDYSRLKPVEGNSWEGQVEGAGLEQGVPYTVYCRVVGKTRACRTDYGEVTWTTVKRGGPAQVTELFGQSLEGSVRLHWKPPAEGRSYRIYQGSDALQLKAVATARQPYHVVTGLRNNQPVWFSVAALDAAGKEGARVPAVLCRATDCTPPAVPSAVRVVSEGGSLVLSWPAVADAEVYKVYVTRPDENYRIPLRTSDPELTVEKVAPGTYSVWVTSADSAGNESGRSKVQTVKIR